MLVMHVAV